MKKQSSETGALLDHFFDFSDVSELQKLSAEIGVEIEYDMLNKSCDEVTTKALIDAWIANRLMRQILNDHKRTL